MNSPLDSASPASIDELFDRDPELLTNEDVQRIVERLRAARKTFAEAEATPTKRGAKGKAPAMSPTGGKLDLGQLGLLDD